MQLFSIRIPRLLLLSCNSKSLDMSIQYFITSKPSLSSRYSWYRKGRFASSLLILKIINGPVIGIPCLLLLSYTENGSTQLELTLKIY
jgi:hypothetical protein